MNSISLKFAKADFTMADIDFKNMTVLEIEIDGTNTRKIDKHCESLAYFDEIVKSNERTGKYLIFTDCTGIADNGGWNYINVIHKEKSITWSYSRDDVRFNFVFPKSSYNEQIQILLEKRQDILNLEPSQVIHPE